MSKAAWAGLLLLGAGLGLTTFFMTAGIPADVTRSVKLLKLEVHSARELHARSMKELDSIIASESAFLDPLPEVKDLKKSAESVSSQLDEFERGLATAMALVEANNRRKRFELRALVDRTSTDLMRLNEAKDMDQIVAQAKRLKSYKTDHKRLVQEARQAVSSIPLEPGLGAQITSTASKRKADYPSAAGKIDSRIASLRTVKNQLDSNRGKLETRATEDPVDYLATGRLVDLVASQAAEYQSRKKQLQQDLNSLSLSEDKVLIDMKSEGGAFFHKYKNIRGDKTETTGWQKVSSNFYRKHEANLGMTLYSKPEGVFPDEATKIASPPGYNYVGNSRYGQWQYRGGSSFWVFYGQYRFMQDLFRGPSYYSLVSRRDYDRYRSSTRRGQAYYGGRRQYGSRGTTTKKRYSASSYVKRAKSSGYRGSNYRGTSGRSGRSGGYRGSRYRGSSFGGSGK